MADSKYKPIAPGVRYGMLTAISREGGTPRHPKWLFKCDCGNTKIINAGNAKSGHTRSCGCFRETNGFTGHPLCKTWHGMINRCHNPKNKLYEYYGARGITVCDRWRNDPFLFAEDMGERPRGHTIERIDNDLGYSPENCVWADKKTQAINRRSTVNITVDGVTRTASEWSVLLGGTRDLVVHRINKLGWNPVKAATKPLRLDSRNRHKAHN